MGELQQSFLRGYQRFTRERVRHGEAALRDAVTVGALALDAALEDAVTSTGYFRMLLHSGRPGRHDTGNMVSKIRTNAASPERDGERTVMAFGWFAGDFEAYFVLQDLGSPPIGRNRRGIPPAHGMFTASGIARRVLAANVRGGDL